MSRMLNVMAAGLVSLTFAAAFLGLVERVAVSASHVAQAQVVPAYGSPMLDQDELL